MKGLELINKVTWKLALFNHVLFVQFEGWVVHLK